MNQSQISFDIREDIRFFAFWLGNGTLQPLDFEFDYEDCIQEDTSMIGGVFSVYLNNLNLFYKGLSKNIPSKRAAQWLVERCCVEYILDSSFEPWELVKYEGTTNVFDTLKKFSIEFAEGLQEENELLGCAYLNHMFNGGDFLEQVFAIFANVVQIDKDDCVVNYDYSKQRVAQYIRHSLDSSYQVLPEFEGWELDLT